MNKFLYIISVLVCGLFTGFSQGCTPKMNGSISQKDSIQIFMEIKGQLDTIIKNDQYYRSRLKPIEEEFGYESIQVQNQWDTIRFTDSINLQNVIGILDTYGWLGADKIGITGNHALFLVIQHSNKATMEKYLPMIQEAVKSGNASSQNFAMLKDRVEMLNQRPQIYGTQIQVIKGEHKLYKVLDEKNINNRRSEVGLEPIEDYLKRFNIVYKTNE
ncbi:MAG: hypothetical protein JXB00_13035 [Bacteroidales bacterium]|nr:hypothetical protein [Bacteroidales bacterium]